MDEGQARVRAVYGHSVDVDLADAGEPARPDALFHGTPPGNLEAILEEGLKPMDRQSVHLSPDRATARQVGRRHAGEPVVLRVDAAALRERGIEVRRRSAAVYTCPRVPPEALAVEEPGPGADPDAPRDPNG